MISSKFTDFYRIDRKVNKNTKSSIKRHLIGLIIPHAGYYYTFEILQEIINSLKNNIFSPKKIIIFGISHNIWLKNPSSTLSEYYETIDKTKIEIDQDFIKKLDIDYVSNEVFENEHSIEVILPILNFVYSDFKIIPILFNSNFSDKLIDKIIELHDKDTLIICSTDLSHFKSSEEAEKQDKKTIDKIFNFEYNKIKEEDLCNKNGMITFLKIMEEFISYIDISLLKYQHSGQITKNNSRVVGYAGFIVYLVNIPTDIKLFISNFVKDILTKAVEKNDKKFIKPILSKKVTKFLEERNFGVFITIYEKNLLRGCIGTFDDTGDLLRKIHNNTLSAAFNDSRFDKITSLDGINKIEISLLTPLKKINNIETEYNHLEHGIYVTNGIQNATFLPKVASENNWTKKETLEHLFNKGNIKINDKVTYYIYKSVSFS